MNGLDPRLTISVIVPVFNGADTLERCLSALQYSDLPIDELIVVDDGSTDGSDSLAKRRGAKIVAIPGGPSGPARARNVAAAQAAGDILVFVDADVEVQPSSLRRLLAPLMREQAVVACFGSYDDQPAEIDVVSLYANLRHHHVHQHSGKSVQTFWAGCGAIRRSAFEAVGGFDEGYRRPSIEDIELGQRLAKAGGEIRVIADAQAKHLKRWRLRSLWRTELWQRALPWSRLMARQGTVPASLNTSWPQRMAAAAALSALLAIIASPFAPLYCCVAFLSAMMMWGGLNYGLMRILFRRGGLPALLGGGALHFAYSLYGPAILVLVLVHARWLSDPAGGNSQHVALALSATLITFLTLVAFACLGLSLWPAESLLRYALAMQSDLSYAYFSLTEIEALQIRAALAVLPFIGLAGLALLLGPAPVRAVLVDGRNLRDQFKVPRSHLFVLASLMLLATALVAIYSSQTMRSDEANSFLNYGTRSPLVALGFYGSTNNHILHSVLMRLSVIIFGDEEWSIRLPAMVFGILCVPLGYAAACRHFDSATALLAASILASAAYSIDLATNARGYTIVHACFLAILAILPEVERRRPSAVVAFVSLAALGAWAIPLMLYPFAIALVWLALAPLQSASRLAAVRGLKLVVTLVLATGVLTLILYTPALIVTGLGEVWDQPGQSTVEALAEAVHGTVAERIQIQGKHLYYAWQMWVFPAGPVVGLAVFGTATLIGFILALRKFGRPRRLAASSVLGLSAIWIITGVPTLPWWTLSFGFPLALMFFACSCAWLIQMLRRQTSLGSPVQTAAVLATFLTGFLFVSAYPNGTPVYIGYRDAPAAATTLAHQGVTQATVMSVGLPSPPINYYLYRIGQNPRLVMRPKHLKNIGNVEDRPETLVQVIRAKPDDMAVAQTRVTPGCREVSREALNTSLIITFRCCGSEIHDARDACSVPPAAVPGFSNTFDRSSREIKVGTQGIVETALSLPLGRSPAVRPHLMGPLSSLPSRVVG